jgi:serine/threonine-protein kinase HipA
LALEHFAEMMLQTESVIETVKKLLPDDFPVEISEIIFKGLVQKAALGQRFIDAQAQS